MKRAISFLSVVLATVMFFTLLVGCEWSKSYTIQYTDSDGTHTMEVAAGVPFSIENLPEKTGYEFKGLYTAESGGEQCVMANGSSSPNFKIAENMVLFPQFVAKTYTVVLDYQGAAVTGNRQFAVDYNQSLPELPSDLSVDHKEFVGWFTQEGCGGVQVADSYGLVPVVSVLNENNFDVNQSTIYLYAGFGVEKLTVTFHSDGETQEVKVAYNTPLSQVATSFRKDGLAVLSWSKIPNDDALSQVFTGNIVENIELYAAEYAPIIQFDSNGGSEVNSVVARGGSAITLPIPTKELAKFSYWEDASGNKFDSATMPRSSITLKAVWQAKIVFDENGGTDVDDISVAAGRQITLPTTKKDGYVFAGWYTEDKEQYTSTTMPSVGMILKAGWYKEKTAKKVFSTNDNYVSTGNSDSPTSQRILMSEIDPDTDFSGKLNIKMEIYFKSYHYYSTMGASGYANLLYGIYSENSRSNSTTLYERTFEHNNIDEYQQREFTVNVSVENGEFFIIRSCVTTSYWRDVKLKDYYIVFYYPDTTNLYL